MLILDCKKTPVFHKYTSQSDAVPVFKRILNERFTLVSGVYLNASIYLSPMTKTCIEIEKIIDFVVYVDPSFFALRKFLSSDQAQVAFSIPFVDSSFAVFPRVGLFFLETLPLHPVSVLMFSGFETIARNILDYYFCPFNST